VKTLYLPIHLPGTYHARSVANKHGLRDALAKYGPVQEIDYVALEPDVRCGTIWAAVKTFEPDLLFTQLQGADPEAIKMYARIRREFPQMAMVNWNGDVYEQHLTSPDMLDLLRYFDWQLVVNGSALETYEREGIQAAFCPFGYEWPQRVTTDELWPDYNVVFLGNNYSEKRQQLYDVLRSLPYKVGIYGVGWPEADGECNYDFATAEALYRRAKICISDNQFPDALGYLSDRPIQILGAGGGILFQQEVANIARMTGLILAEHYFKFFWLESLPKDIDWWLQPEQDALRARQAAAGQRLVLERHSWDARVKQLVEEWLPKVRERAS